MLVNTWIQWASGWQDFGVTAPAQVDSAGKHPVLLIGAVDVLSWRFRTFSSRRDRITAGGAPDELWVIQINPRQRDTEPITLAEIADRRNELSGNLSLYQELAFIEKIDQLLETGLLDAGGKYKRVVVRVIELSRSALHRASTASKLNRDPRFIQNLISHGEQQAGEFLAALAFERAWAGTDVAAVMGHFAEDPELVSEPPFSRPGRHRGSGPARQFVQEQLSAGVRMDLTHKLIARDRVTWTLGRRNDPAGTHPPGQAEAQFRDGKVTSLRLGPLPPSP